MKKTTRYSLVTATLALALAGCSSGGGTSAIHTSSDNTTTTTTSTQSTADWLTGGGKAVMLAVVGDSDDFINDLNANDATAVITDCKDLTSDVMTAQNYAPIPNAAWMATWNDALSSYSTGAADCAIAFDTNDSDLANTAGGKIQDGINSVSTLTSQIGGTGTAS